MASTRSVWSPDCGARLIQVQSILQHWPHWWVSYPGDTIDPLRTNSPLSFYEFGHNGHTYIFYSFVFALISAFFFHYVGYAGLALLPMLCGVGTAIAVYGLARLLQFRYPLGPLFLVALATPIIVYSVVFWDHSITTFVAAVCLYLCIRATATGRSSNWFLAGMVFGAGLWIHEILIPYLPAMLVGIWWNRRHHPWLKNAGLLLAGVALLLIPLALVNASVYGTPFGPHLSKNHLGSTGAISHFLLSPSLWGPGSLYTLFAWGDNSPGFTWQLRTWLDHPSDAFKWEIQMSLKMALPVVSWMILAGVGLWRRHWFTSLVLFVGMMTSGFWVLLHPNWPHSLFYASPLLALAFAGLSTQPTSLTSRPSGAPTSLAPLPLDSSRPQGPGGPGAEGEFHSALTPQPPLPRTGEGEFPSTHPSIQIPGHLKQTVAIITVVYVLGALLNPALGGSEYGSRYLLIAVPAMTLLAWAAIESLLTAIWLDVRTQNRSGGAPMRSSSQQPAKGSLSEVGDKLILVGMAALVTLSVLLQWHGLSTVHKMQAANRSLADSIAGTPDRVVITTVWWAPLDGASAYDRKLIFYAGDPEHIYGDYPANLMPSLLKKIRRADWRTFTAIGWNNADLVEYANGAGYLPISAAPTAMNLKLTRFGMP